MYVYIPAAVFVSMSPAICCYSLKYLRHHFMQRAQQQNEETFRICYKYSNFKARNLYVVMRVGEKVLTRWLR